MDLETTQRQLEMKSVEAGVERYFKALTKDQAKGREMDTTVGQYVMRDMLEILTPEVHELQKLARKRLVEGQTTGQRLTGWELPIAAADTDALAYIAARSILNSGAGRGPDGRRMSMKHALAARIGNMVNLEMQWAELREAEKARAKTAPPNRITLMKRQVKQINPRSVRKWLRKMDDLTTTRWDVETRMKVGLVLYDIVKRTCGDYVTFTDVTTSSRGRLRRLVLVSLSGDVLEEMDDVNASLSERAPWYMPMISPPRPWAWVETETGGRYEGGYLTHSEDLIRSTRQEHTAAGMGKETVSQVCLDALNTISATQWRINEKVRLVAARARATKRHEVLPVSLEQEVPEEVPAAEWASMAPRERGAIKSQRRVIYDNNFRLHSKRLTMGRVLDVAAAFTGYDAIYFPHMLDFRGRAYPSPQDLHPQGDDFARGLLTFARGKPLGATGLPWLAYSAAGTYGMDKLTRDEQVTWVIDHLDDLYLVARDPLGAGYDFWKEAEEPWQFLAVAMELEQAFALEDPTQFVSSLPVYVDGSCNGLQHLSAMGRDPVGAHATNLTDDPVRQDIYQIVADKVAERAAADAWGTLTMHEEQRECARHWDGRVTRKTVKRGVMTVPYGLTDIGMRDQLIADRWTEDLDGDPMKNAGYLRDLMKAAIDDTVVKATEIMEWMQANATIMAKNGVPMSWTTPAGLSVRQAYYNKTAKTITTLMGTTVLYQQDKSATLNVRKQALSIAPNIIHSFDAAHMMLTVTAAAQRGLEDFAVIHDSFGCHACDMEGFLDVVREQFVAIYKQDWFASLQAEWQAAVGPDVPLVQPPSRGDFDTDTTLHASFFFA